MTLNIIFIRSKKGFNKKERRKIENVIRKTASHAAKILNLEGTSIINFTVYPFGKKYVFGCTQAENWIQIDVPPKKINEAELKNAIYHEMYHIGRGYSFHSKKKFSLLNTLFSEGLAVVFEIEQVPRRIPISSAFVKKWLPQLRKENPEDTDFSYDKWFWGKEGRPKRLGYKIGTYLVNQIKKHHPELTAAKLVKKNAKYLLKLSKVKL